MQKNRLTTVVLAATALGLSACGESGSPVTSGAPDNGPRPTIVIGKDDPQGPSLKGSGKWAAGLREPKPFFSIDARDGITTKVSVGRPISISVEADDNIAGIISTKVESGRLTIQATKSFQATRAPEVVVTVPKLSEAIHTGSGDMIIDGVGGETFKADISGSGTFYANGRVLNEKLSLTGPVKVDCVKLMAENVSVEMSGPGNCSLYAEKALNVKVNGEGTVKYLGEPHLTKAVVGNGTVEQLNL